MYAEMHEAAAARAIPAQRAATLAQTFICKGLAAEMHRTREAYPIGRYKQLCRNIEEEKYSVGIACTGGLLDLFGALQAGLYPIWGCEQTRTCKTCGKTSQAPIAVVTFGGSPRTIRAGQPW